MPMRVYIFAILLLLTILAGVDCEQWYEVGNPHFLDTETVFPAVDDKTTIKILKFFSPWCKYCRYVKAYFDNYKNSHEVSPNLKFYQFDCQKNGPNFCWQHFQVRAYPSVVFIDEKGERTTRLDGLYPEDVIVNILNQFNNKANQLTQSQQKHQDKSDEVKKQDQKEEVAEKKEQAQQEANKIEQKVLEEPKQQIKQTKQVKNQEKKEQKVEQKKEQKIQLKHEQPKIQQPKPAAQPQQKQAQTQPQTTTTTTPPPADSIPSKIEKQQLSEQSVEKQTKVDPANPEAQSKFVEVKESSSSFQFVKYLLYLVAISVGVLYGVKIFTTRSSPEIGTKNTRPAPNPEQAQKRQGPKITSRDIQNQILVQEVLDENL